MTLNWNTGRFFNAAALVCVAITAGIVASFHYVVPSVFAGRYKNIVVSAVVLIVSTLAEILGLRAKLVFVPLWIWGVGMVALHSYLVWGFVGILLLLILVAFAIWRLVKATEAGEIEQWAKAGVALSELRAVGPSADVGTLWRLLEESLYLPVAGDLTSESCAHNLEVTKISMDQAMISARADLETWKTLESFLKENRAVEKPVPLPFGLRTKVHDLIQARRAESEHVMALTKVFADALEVQRNTVRRD